MKNLTLLAIILAPALAFADEATDHVTRATRFYNIQEWGRALDEYKQAYALDPKPETLWAIAQTQRQSGNCRGAILSYKAYLRTASAAGANAADEFIKKCEADLKAQQQAMEDATAPAPVKPASTPSPTPQQAQPAAAPAVHKGPTQPRSWAFDPLGDTLFVLGLGGLALGGTLITIGTANMGNASRQPTWSGYDAAKSHASSEQSYGALATVGGALFVGLAVWRFANVASHDHHETPTGVAISPTAGGAFASYAGSF